MGRNDTVIARRNAIASGSLRLEEWTILRAIWRAGASGILEGEIRERVGKDFARGVLTDMRLCKPPLIRYSHAMEGGGEVETLMGYIGVRARKWRRYFITPRGREVMENSPRKGAA